MTGNPVLFAGHLQFQARQSHLVLGQTENTCNFKDTNTSETLRESGNGFIVSADTTARLCEYSCLPQPETWEEEIFHSFNVAEVVLRETKHT